MRRAVVIFSTVLLFLAIVLLSADFATSAPPAQDQTPVPPESGLTEEQLAAIETANRLSAIQFPGVDEVRRGCPACHALVDAESGRFTLPYEAHERVEVRGREHPSVSLSGVSITPTDDVAVTVCLECHAAGTGDRFGMGVVAPLSLRDIVHPAHMSSQYFQLHYAGNCFTCHNVDGAGEWELLTQKVDVNDKGVPNPDLLPIPGAQPIGP